MLDTMPAIIPDDVHIIQLADREDNMLVDVVVSWKDSITFMLDRVDIRQDVLPSQEYYIDNMWSSIEKGIFNGYKTLSGHKKMLIQGMK